MCQGERHLPGNASPFPAAVAILIVLVGPSAGRPQLPQLEQYPINRLKHLKRVNGSQRQYNYYFWRIKNGLVVTKYLKLLHVATLTCAYTTIQYKL